MNWEQHRAPLAFGAMLGVVLGVSGLYVNDWRWWLIALYANAGFVWANRRSIHAP
jgi:hypothetical protein